MSFSTRGWLIASRSMEIARKEIELAARYGVNQIQLSHSMVHNVEEVLESEELRRHVAELITLAHKHSIELLIWSHELHEMPGSCFKEGKLDLTVRDTWDFVEFKYRKLFELLPELDGVVLTVTETQFRMDDENDVHIERRPPHVLARMVEMINRVCVRNNARLIVRTFTWAPRTMLWFVEAFEDIAPEVAVMTKEGWGDWYQYQPANPMLGLFGTREQLIELDCWGEYAGETLVPWVAGDFIRSRLKTAHEREIRGAVARVDRMEISTFDTFNEFNTIAFSRLVHDLDTDLDTLWAEWLQERFGTDDPRLRTALERTNDIIQCAFFNLGIKNSIGGDMTLPRNEGVSSIRFWQNFNGQWDPEMAVRAQNILHPTEETVVALVAEKDRAISLCHRSLADVDGVLENMKNPALVELHNQFEALLVVAKGWRAVTQVVAVHRALEERFDSRLADWFEDAGEHIHDIADEIERRHGRLFRLVPPAQMRELWLDAKNIHSERVAWSRPMGYFIAAAPAVGDITCNGLPDVVTVSFSREISAHTGTGEHLWTVRTRGERSQYPHFCSPLILPADKPQDVRILAGGADGRLYCLSGEGKRVWEFRTGNRIDAAPAGADLDRDGSMEIFVASMDGKLYCLSYEGRQKWSVDLEESIFAAPVITPSSEVIVATLSGTIAAVSWDGKIRWRKQLETHDSLIRQFKGVPDGRLNTITEGDTSAIHASPLVADLNNDGKVDMAFVTSTGRAMVLDQDGAVQWEGTAMTPIYSSPCIIGRGTARSRVVIGADDGKIRAFDSRGRPVWHFETKGPVRSTPVVVPASVAGKECIVVGSDDKRIYVIDADGKEMEEYRIGGAVFGAPAVADMDGDGFAEIVVGCYDHRIYVLNTTWRTAPGQIIAGMFRGGRLRQGV